MADVLQHSRRDDLSEVEMSTFGTSLADLLGRWKNTKEDTGQILEATITQEGEQFFLHILAPSDPEPTDWGKCPIEIYYSAGRSQIVTGVSGFFDFGFMETDVLCMIKYGILVVMTYNRFKDDSGRKNYVIREFFHRIKA